MLAKCSKVCHHTLCTHSSCSIITQLESLKKEAAEVQKKVEETDVVMAEVEQVSQQYLPLSSACSSIYFTLEGLNQVCRMIGVNMHHNCILHNVTAKCTCEKVTTS